MRVLCFEYRIIDIEYFFDRCTIWELNDLIDFIPYADRALWDSQRLIAYSALAGKTKKALKLTDITKFKWDENERVSKQLTEDIKKRMKAMQDVQWTTSNEGLNLKEVLKDATMANTSR